MATGNSSGLQPHELKALAIELCAAMPPPQTKEAANDLAILMADLEMAGTIAMLGTKADGLEPGQAKAAFLRIRSIVESVHNDLDVLRERLEAGV